jgi:hypothetical protein
MTVHTTTRHLYQSWASFTQSTSYNPVSLRFDSILSFHLRLGLPSGPHMEHDSSCDSPQNSTLISLSCTRPTRKATHSAAWQQTDAQRSDLHDAQGIEASFLRTQPKCLTKIPAKAKRLFWKDRRQKRLRHQMWLYRHRVGGTAAFSADKWRQKVKSHKLMLARVTQLPSLHRWTAYRLALSTH